MQAEPNEHFADEFKLASQAVVVTEWEDGKVIRWKNLEEIWDHLESKQGFGDYVKGESRSSCATNRILLRATPRAS